MHRYGALVVDIGIVALSPFLALLIRDNFVLYSPHWEAITGYAVISFATVCISFLAAGSHKTLWQYTSLPDVLRTMAIVSIAVLLAVSISFVANRLEGVARSVPVIQWLVLTSALMGTRVAYRIWHERGKVRRLARTDLSVEHVLIIGTGSLAELYLRAVAEYGAKLVSVAGILTDRADLTGRRFYGREILGKPEQVLEIINRLEVHGVIIARVIVAQPLGEFSPNSGQALLDLERNSDVEVDWLVERLGIKTQSALDDRPESENPPGYNFSPRSYLVETVAAARYDWPKRGLDILLALLFVFVLSPLILGLGLLVCFDVGFPIVFWQQRPGRFGQPFKLFKFCTMRRAHDANGNRIPDAKRSSIIGRLLRRTKLDELPQLYNVLIGEMSFVGPRPLLPADQPREKDLRLTVRPGLTGLAQIYGGRELSADDKNALDILYIREASIGFDLRILLQTTWVLIKGEQVDQNKIILARQGLMHLQARGANRASSSLSSKV
jgi:lipopolysaccharide/colanic/teichoic acid biosynthesis glycosyltransferase